MNESSVAILDRWFERRLEAIHTTIPGTIQSYDAGTRTATVLPSVKMRLASGDSVAIPPIDNVPVVFPGSADFTLHFPLKKGDGVLLLFSETGIGNFLNSSGQVVDADDQSRFSLTDAIAIPGLWTKNAVPVKDVPADALLLQYRGKTLTISADGIALDSGGAAVAREGDPVSVDLTGLDIQTLASALLATGAFTPSGSPPAPGTPVTLSGGSISSGSSTVTAGG